MDESNERGRHLVAQSLFAVDLASLNEWDGFPVLNGRGD